MDVTEVEDGLRELNDEIIRGYGAIYIIGGGNMLTESAVVSSEKRHPKISSSSM